MLSTLSSTAWKIEPFKTVREKEGMKRHLLIYKNKGVWDDTVVLESGVALIYKA